jgi:hypothetical protein
VRDLAVGDVTRYLVGTVPSALWPRGDEPGGISRRSESEKRYSRFRILLGFPK